MQSNESDPIADLNENNELEALVHHYDPEMGVEDYVDAEKGIETAVCSLIHVTSGMLSILGERERSHWHEPTFSLSVPPSQYIVLRSLSHCR